MDEEKTNEGITRAAQHEEWRGLIAEQHASGKSASVFCRERGIPTWKFWYWRKALLGDSAANNGFVQMQVNTAQPGVRPVSRHPATVRELVPVSWPTAGDGRRRTSRRTVRLWPVCRWR